MNKNLSYYVNCFTHLRRDLKNGGAPHKPILLLSVLGLFSRGLFYNNEIRILPELVALFKSNWNKLVDTNHHPIFTLPFYHMNSEPFWKLIPNVGCEKWIESKSSMRSFSNLNSAIKVTLIDEQLSKLLLQPENRDILKISILDRYFPDNKTKYGSDENNDLFSSSVVQESSKKYKKKIIELKSTIDTSSFQEEIFIRSGIFKREIPKIYNNSCAISGLRIDAITNISMIDACHIIPFSEGYNDSLTNGLALCPNLHRAFDRGLISISNNYKVILNNNFIENEKSTLNLTQFNDTKIILPDNKEYYPSIESLIHHRKRFGFD